MLPLLLLLATTIRPAGSEAPARQPQLASANGMVALTFGSGSAVFFSSSADQGRTFDPPVKVAEAGGLALGRHRGPRIAILKDGSLLISAVAAHGPGTQKSGQPGTGNLRVWRSADRGLTWKAASIVNDVPDSAREGLHAMAAGPDGSVFAAWLDLRKGGMALYGARSTDGGFTWSKNAEIYASRDGEICSCCHPSLNIDGDGRIWVMWRNSLDGNRDVYITHSDDGARFQAAIKQGTGSWKLNACPMDGGGLVVHKGKATSAWRRENGIYVAEPGLSERLIGTGKDVTIARSSRGLYLAWTGSGIVVVTPQHPTPRIIAREGGFPTLAPLPGGAALVAWEAADSIHFDRIE